jgi:hypothetical protein
MAWNIRSPLIGAQPIATTSTVKNHPLGTVVQADDPTYGTGEFVYLEGAASTVAGLVYFYSLREGAIVTTTSGVVDGGSPIAVAMSANVNGQYGWYQIGGDAVVLKTATKIDPATTFKVYLSGTAGRLMPTSVAGRQILGARWSATATVTTTTSTALVTLNRPSQKTGTLV